MPTRYITFGYRRVTPSHRLQDNDSCFFFLVVVVVFLFNLNSDKIQFKSHLTTYLTNIHVHFIWNSRISCEMTTHLRSSIYSIDSRKSDCPDFTDYIAERILYFYSIETRKCSTVRILQNMCQCSLPVEWLPFQQVISVKERKSHKSCRPSKTLQKNLSSVSIHLNAQRK